MKIVETVFDCCFVMEPFLREDNRCVMEVLYRRREQDGALFDFDLKEQRIYRIPKKHTFFGIHDQSVDNPQGKLIGVIQGRGLDYIVDLRSESSTFRQYKCLELDGNHPRLVYIAPGFGHGFLTLEDNTIQTFAMDAEFRDERSRAISYKDTEIGLSLPVEDVILSDYDADTCNFDNRMVLFE